MDNQAPYITPTPTQPTQPVQPMSPVQPVFNQPPMPQKGSGKPTLSIIIAVALVILLLIVSGVMYGIQNSKAGTYLRKTEDFAHSTGLKQYEEALNEFAAAQDGLYKDMYYCRASSERMFALIDHNGVSYFANDAGMNALNEYREAYDFMMRENPGVYTAFPVVGGLGKSGQAKKAHEVVKALTDQAGQLNETNEYSAYCMNDLYGMLAGQLTYLEEFADEARLTDTFNMNGTNAQHRLDSLEQYKSYGNIQLEGFEKVNELRTQFLDGVISNLTQLRDLEKTAKRNTPFVVGGLPNSFTQNITFFDEALVAEAGKQAERYITVDVTGLQSSLSQVKALAQ